MAKDLCPCGSNNTYSSCCEPIIHGKTAAPTAEALMRSRYTAYVKQQIDHIATTHAESSAHDFDKDAAMTWAKTAVWKGLEIVKTEEGGPADDEGTVEFIARFELEEKPLEHHELSHFVKQNGKWFYSDGKTVQKPIKRSEPKLGRNDPCHCGSGKKLKKCCVAA